MTHRRAPSSRLPIPSDDFMASIKSSAPLPSSILTNVVSRKTKQRNTFLALFALILLSGYVLLVWRPQLSLAPIGLRPDLSLPTGDESDRSSSRLFRYPSLSKHRKTSSTAASSRPQVHLTDPQELAAISSFIASLPQNVIPPSVDPALPIDPQLVLDFDTRSPKAELEVQAMVEDVWARNPVILFSKLHSPISREIKTILANMNLRPSPTIFEVDQRDDAEILTPLLFRLTQSTELPILLIGGKPVGSIHQIRTLSGTGELRTAVAEAGAVPDGAKKKNGRH